MINIEFCQRIEETYCKHFVQKLDWKTDEYFLQNENIFSFVWNIHKNYRLEKKFFRRLSKKYKMKPNLTNLKGNKL